MRCKCYTQKNRRCKRVVKSGDYCFQHLNCASPKLSPPRVVSKEKKQKSKRSHSELKQLSKAIENNDLGKVRHLIKLGAPLDVADIYGRTPLHNATLANNLSIIQLLVNAGVPVDIKDFYGFTPLHYAARF